MTDERTIVGSDEIARAAQGDNRTLMDYALSSIMSSIRRPIRMPAIEAKNFEIEPVTIQMIQSSQFSGLPSEDPKGHMANFLEICDIFKTNGVSDDAIRLRLFPLSLRDRAKRWLYSLPDGSITTWDDLAWKFLARFFPPSKVSMMRKEISNFAQFNGESLYDAWERYKELLWKCPHHDLPKWMQVEFFYSGLGDSSRTLIDANAGGAFMRKTQDEAYELIEETAMNNYQWSSERVVHRKAVEIHEIEAIAALRAQVASLTKQLQGSRLTANTIQTSSLLCDLCQGNHPSERCDVGNPFSAGQAEHANFVDYNHQRNNPYSSTCNPGWWNHPNFSWNNQNVMKPPQGQPPQQKNSPLEEAVIQLANNTVQFVAETKNHLQNQAAQIRNLEAQVGQIANMLSRGQPGSVPRITEVNPSLLDTMSCNNFQKWERIGGSFED